MDDLEPHRIVQIMPAVGWFARYKWDDGEEDENPIVCWALVEWENKGEPFYTVEGVENEDGESHLCCVYSGLIGYVLKAHSVSTACRCGGSAEREQSAGEEQGTIQPPSARE